MRNGADNELKAQNLEPAIIIAANNEKGYTNNIFPQ